MIDKMIEILAGGGWSDLENVGQNFGKMAREQGAAERQETERQAAIFAATFGTDDGKKALDILLRMTLLRQPGDAERAPTAEASALAAAERRGQNSIVFMLLARLQQHHNRTQDNQPGGVL
jgi:hypothetical protein